MNINDIRSTLVVSLIFSMLLCCLPVTASSQRADSSIFAKPINLEASVKSERVPRSEQKGDTLIFNAAAYQVIDNADSERLLSKMPGISITDSGVETGGKEVRKILIDGQEFFGNDVLTALRNVPADMVKQIEVINRLSEEAQLTGVDDGDGYKAINIVTKRKKGTGLTTGQVYGTYGLSDQAAHRHNYIVGGNMTHFTDKRTISVIGMSNNISKFNFTSSDKSFNIKGLSGLSDVHAVGVNYTSKKCNFTYFFNDISNTNRPVSDKVSLTSKEGRDLLTHNVNDYRADNMTHKFKGKITLNQGKNHTFVISPSITFERMNNNRDLYGLYTYTYTDADKSDSFVRKQRSFSDNDRWTIRAGTDLSYRYRFKSKRRRSLSATAKYNFYRYSALDRSWEYRWNKEEADTSDFTATNYTYIQNRDRVSLQQQITGKVTYTEPISKRSFFSGEYTFYTTTTQAENLIFPFKDGEYSSEPKERVSAINRSTFYHNRVGVRYNYYLKKLSITAAATYQNTIFDGWTRLPEVGSNRRTYHHPMYTFVANLPFNKSNTLRIEAKGSTRNPSNQMLQDIVDRSSTSNVRAGNPDITPAYLHTAEINYINTNKKAGTTFSLSATYTGSPNYFCDSLVINTPGFGTGAFDENGEEILLGDGDQFVKPINLGGYHKLMVKSSFAMPLDFIRCNFRLGAQASVQRLPGMINGDYVPINRNWFQLSGRLDSNISKNIDFTLNYQARYVMNEYTGKKKVGNEYVANKVENNYMFHNFSAEIKWIFLRNFTFTGAFVYKKNQSISGLYDENFYLCDLFLGHRFLKSRRLEVSVGVNDLLNNNARSYWHSISASGRTDGVNIGLGRYFSAQVIWHFRAGTKPKNIVK